MGVELSVEITEFLASHGLLHKAIGCLERWTLSGDGLHQIISKSDQIELVRAASARLQHMMERKAKKEAGRISLLEARIERMRKANGFCEEHRANRRCRYGDDCRFFHTSGDAVPCHSTPRLASSWSLDADLSEDFALASQPL